MSRKALWQGVLWLIAGASLAVVVLWVTGSRSSAYVAGPVAPSTSSERSEAWRRMSPTVVVTETTFLPLVLRAAGPCIPAWADGFGNPDSGWPIGDDPSTKYAYVNGEYQILVKAADAYTWASPGVQMVDGLIAADLRFGAPGDGGDNGGIVFGQQPSEQENFYRYVVGRDGGYCIQRHEAQAGWHKLNCGAAPGYVPYPGTNRLGVSRHGEGITAYLNGEYVATVFDDEYTGDLLVGLSAGTAVGRADTRFDDYLVFSLVGCTDTRPPSVVSTDPANGATNVSRDLKTVSVTFSEAMDPGRWSMVWGGMGDFEGSYQAPTHTFVFTRMTPGRLDPQRTYTVTINSAEYEPGFVDLGGNPAPTSTFHFTTGD